MTELEEKKAELEALYEKVELFSDEDDWSKNPEVIATATRIADLEDWVDAHDKGELA